MLQAAMFKDDCFCRCRQIPNCKKALHFFAETMAQKFQIMQAKPRQESLRP
jgi:hypothetical protein